MSYMTSYTRNLEVQEFSEGWQSNYFMTIAMITCALQSQPQGTDVRSKSSPCLETLTCSPRWRHLHHLEGSILRCPHPQTLLAPAHAPWVLSLLRLD